MKRGKNRNSSFLVDRGEAYEKGAIAERVFSTDPNPF